VISLSGEPLDLVPIEERHRGYVRGTWIKSYRELANGTGVPKDLIVAGGESIVDVLLDRAQVAVAAKSPGTVHAWICGEKGALYFVYVPFELRRKGIASAMIRKVCR
jgi:hypothetical protein